MLGVIDHFVELQNSGLEYVGLLLAEPFNGLNSNAFCLLIVTSVF